MLIEQNEFNSEKLLEIYKSAYMNAEVCDNGEILIDIDGTRVYARAHEKKPFFTLSQSWLVKPDADRRQVLELANRINDRMIMVRCCCYTNDAQEHTLYIDHWTMTEGGITGNEVVSATRRFVKVAREGIAKFDNEDIIG